MAEPQSEYKCIHQSTASSIRRKATKTNYLLKEQYIEVFFKL